FTDVGAAYFLNKAPGYVGLYLGLTGEIILGKDVVYINAADALIPTADLDLFFKELKEEDWLNKKVKKGLNNLIGKYDKQDDYVSNLALQEKNINKHFNYTTVEAIVEGLEEERNEFALTTKKTLLEKSPFSLK